MSQNVRTIEGRDLTNLKAERTRTHGPISRRRPRESIVLDLSFLFGEHMIDSLEPPCSQCRQDRAETAGGGPLRTRSARGPDR